MFIGVMSGTSLDAIDIVAVSFNMAEHTNDSSHTQQLVTLHATHSIDFEDDFRDELLSLTTLGDNEIERMGAACVKFGGIVGNAINQMIDLNHLDKTEIQAIGSHGQTIRHRPDVGFSLQISDPNIVAEITHIPVIADFRRRDLAAGGQGAPLVPAFHAAILQHQTINRIVLNLGGMANISVLPALNDPIDVIGFDTGPANVLMDAWCYLHTGQRFDESGHWASQGTVHYELFDVLHSHSFFMKEYPKSTGREDFNLEWLQATLEEFDGIEAVDVQATLLKLTARSVADAILQTPVQYGEVWLCGGGAYNSALCELLASLLPTFTLHSTAEIGLAATWVEATAFAWLARQRLLGLAGNLPTVTGAKGFRVLGGVYWG